MRQCPAGFRTGIPEKHDKERNFVPPDAGNALRGRRVRRHVYLATAVFFFAFGGCFTACSTLSATRDIQPPEYSIIFS